MYLRDIKTSVKLLHGKCNSGTTNADRTVRYGDIFMCTNNRGVSNLLSITQLEQDRYRVTYDTLKDWVVHASNGPDIVFKRDTVICNGMLYLYTRKIQPGCAMLQTFRKNFDGFTRKKNVYPIQVSTGDD